VVPAYGLRTPPHEPQGIGEAPVDTVPHFHLISDDMLPPQLAHRIGVRCW
jgi:hypothetical protein